MNGVLNLISNPGQASAPAAATASIPDHASPEVPDNATLAASQQSTQLLDTNSSLNGSQVQVQALNRILCRPVPVRRANNHNSAALQQSSGCDDSHLNINSLVLLFAWFMIGINIGQEIENIGKAAVAATEVLWVGSGLAFCFACLDLLASLLANTPFASSTLQGILYIKRVSSVS